MKSGLLNAPNMLKTLNSGQKGNRQKGCPDKEWVEAGGRQKIAIPLSFSIIDFSTCRIHEFLWKQRNWYQLHFERSSYLYNQCNLSLQYTFRSAIFLKFGFLGQSSGWRIISNFLKEFLKKTKFWWRNGSFTFLLEVKVYL